MSGLPEDAHDAFLWAVDKFSDDRRAYKAEAFARECVKVFKGPLSIEKLVDIASSLHDGFSQEKKDDLVDFIKRRHANYRIGGNVSGAMWK